MTSAIGLKTQIWNNHFRSLIFLLLFPVIIGVTYALALAVLLLFIAYQDAIRGTNFPFLIIFEKILFGYWYVPYVIVTLRILILYIRQKRSINLDYVFRVVTRENQPKLYDILEQLCISRGLSVPRLLVCQCESINAFTIGLSRDTYCIVLTLALVRHLSEPEVEAVLAHELAHIINGDTRLLFVMGTVGNMLETIASDCMAPVTAESTLRVNALHGAFDLSDLGFPETKDSLLVTRLEDNGATENAQGGIAFYLLPFFVVFKLGYMGALLARLLVSGSREFIADAAAVELTKNPEAIISMLGKIHPYGFGIYHDPVLQPLLVHCHNRGDFIPTHPPIEERIEALKSINHIAPEPQTEPQETIPSDTRTVW